MKFRDLYNLIEEPTECHIVIEKELKSFFQTSKLLWLSSIDYILKLQPLFLPILRSKYLNDRSDFRNQITFTNTIYDSNMQPDLEIDIQKLHKLDSEQRRREFAFYERVTKHLPLIMNMNFNQGPEFLPLIYQEVCNRALSKSLEPSIDEKTKIEEPEAIKNGEECEDKISPVHLVFLCHGIQGSHEDMLRLKMFISNITPDNVVVRSACSYESDTGAEIYLMGRRFSEEVKDVLLSLEKNQNSVKSISFVGFSLGGLVARAAFSHLEKYGSLFNTFITISTPHLGDPESSDSLIFKGSSSSKRLRHTFWHQQDEIDERDSIGRQ